MLIKIPKGWEIPERESTPESSYWNRRQILTAAGFLGLQQLARGEGLYPAKHNPEFTQDSVTPEFAATGYNNFYEFDANDKQAVKDKVGAFVINPWKVEISGLVAKSKTMDLDDIVKLAPLEERLYRFRCVEAWAMSVPWIGFPLSHLIKACDPKPDAKFVRFITVLRPKEMPGLRTTPHYPWPYYEGLRMDEAMHPLAMVVTGMYGKPLPKQNGAPFRIIVPWKYGYKSCKSIAKIEFVSKQPSTFWMNLGPSEYGFYSNVDPTKPHPRWSQAYEKVLPDMQRRATPKFNGYEKYVASLYNGKEF